MNRWEQEHHIRLPEEYQQFITTIADGGTQPFYGLYGLLAKQNSRDHFEIIYRKKFLYTVRTPLLCSDLSDAQNQRYALWQQ